MARQAWLEGWREIVAPEHDALLFARQRADGDAPAPEVGALLEWAAECVDARTAVEVGSAAGVSGLWLVPALSDGGMLTTIDDDPHNHALANDAYVDGGVAPQVRAILNDPLVVLPRLADGAYDLALLQSWTQDPHTLLDHALRLVRPGGMLILRGLAGDDTETTPQSPPAAVVDAADFLAEVVRHERLLSMALPIDTGVVVAIRLPDA